VVGRWDMRRLVERDSPVLRFQCYSDDAVGGVDEKPQIHDCCKLPVDQPDLRRSGSDDRLRIIRDLQGSIVGGR